MTTEINHIQLFLQTIPSSPWVEIENMFIPELFLQNLKWVCYKPNEINNLDKLCKKVDVSKVIFKSYSSDLSKKLSNEAINYDSYNRLACHLVGGFSATHDFKFLNTLLKIMDGILIKPQYHMPLKLRNLCEGFLKNVL